MADISKRLEKAEKYLQRSKPEAALEEYLDILEDQPRNDQARHAAADLCLALDRRPQAAELFSGLFEQEFEAGESAKGSITYKKLCRVTTPTPMQTFHYAQLTEKRVAVAILLVRKTKRVTSPKLPPPPPRNAQKRSG